MPVSEADVGTTLITAFKLVKEQTKLGLGWETATVHCSINRQVVIRRQDGPLLGDFERDWSV